MQVTIISDLVHDKFCIPNIKKWHTLSCMPPIFYVRIFYALSVAKVGSVYFLKSFILPVILLLPGEMMS